MNKDNLQKLFESHKNIDVIDVIPHMKASDSYVSVTFRYKNDTWEGWVPYIYRRTNMNISSEKEVEELLLNLYPKLEPTLRKEWLAQEKKLWETTYKKQTKRKPYFDSLVKGKWSCRKCITKNTQSSNDASRIRDIKNMGYVLATNTNKLCSVCNINTTHDILLPCVKIDAMEYETWTPKLRKKILKTLNNFDVYENRDAPHLLPDHKFSEIRWDEETPEQDDDSMSEEAIKNKYQLLSNQRNQQKREVCRKCFQTGKRGTIFGITYYYGGTEDWSKDIPIKGKEAEAGCVGCGWYDIEKWREDLNKLL